MQVEKYCQRVGRLVRSLGDGLRDAVWVLCSPVMNGESGPPPARGLQNRRFINAVSYTRSYHITVVFITNAVKYTRKWQSYFKRLYHRQTQDV